MKKLNNNKTLFFRFDKILSFSPLQRYTVRITNDNSARRLSAGSSCSTLYKNKIYMVTSGSVTFNHFPKKPWFLHVCSTSLLKTLREKEKLLVTSNFSFSQSVFYTFQKHSSIFTKFEIVVCKLFQFGRVYNLSFGKGLIN